MCYFINNFQTSVSLFLFVQSIKNMSKNLCEHDKLLGTVIGDDYQIEEKLGLGGMGAVFRAKQISVAQTVAVKVILPEKMQDATLVQRFLREARTGLLLSHPNNVKS